VQKLTIHIFGESYVFETETETSRAEKIVAHLEREVARAESRDVPLKGQVNKNIILISAALNVINDYFELKDKYKNLFEILSKRTSRIIESFD
jgi:cell division protein ZapA (FtsZ GTPase activity inhibitor)